MGHGALEETCNPERGKLTNGVGVREVPQGIVGLGWGWKSHPRGLWEWGGMEESPQGIVGEDLGEEGGSGKPC